MIIAENHRIINSYVVRNWIYNYPRGISKVTPLFILPKKIWLFYWKGLYLI